MTMLLAPADALVESERLIKALERCRHELPFADEFLAVQRPAHEELARSKLLSEQAVTAWRTALAHRWDCEIAGRRLYKQIYRQMVAHYGSDEVPEVQVVSRGGAEVNSSPLELLTDLRRMEAALAVSSEQLPFARSRLDQIHLVCAALEQAILDVSVREADRRTMVLDRRMAQEAYRRISTALRHALFDHYGERASAEFSELFA